LNHVESRLAYIQVQSIKRTLYDFRKADTESIRRDLQSVNWVEQFSSLSAEQSWLMFKDYLEKLQQKHIPTDSTVPQFP